MKRFTKVVQQLDQSTSSTAKVMLLTEYFIQEHNEQNKLWAIALFTSKRPPRTVSTTLMREWSAAVAGIPLWLFEENYHIVGDLAETISLIIPRSEWQAEYTLTQCINDIQELKPLNEEAKKERILAYWFSLDHAQLWIFNKLITGGFRVGVSKNLVTQALSKAMNQPTNTIAHHLMGDWSPMKITWQQLFDFESKEADLSKPYPFYLAHSIDKKDLESISPIEWLAEWKYDGIRSQVIKRGNNVFVWSRGEELMTEKFPELAQLASLDFDFVIDGEILVWQDEKPRDFQYLQTRVTRKNVTKKVLLENPIILMAYDILEWERADIRAQSLDDRRSILEMVVERIKQEVVKISPLLSYDNVDQLQEMQMSARDKGVEGLMLKKKSSIYHTGRKSGEMWKWKVDPYTIDAVMLYAQRGHGRRANLFSDFTFALWHGDRLVPFAKAYSGLTDLEMKEITEFVKSNTIESFGPVSSVNPTLVFELAFEGINLSSRHKAGIAVRFPRIVRWRKDKIASEANTLEEIKKLL